MRRASRVQRSCWVSLGLVKASDPVEQEPVAAAAPAGGEVEEAVGGEGDVGGEGQGGEDGVGNCCGRVSARDWSPAACL